MRDRLSNNDSVRSNVLHLISMPIGFVTHELIKGVVNKTPVMTSRTLNHQIDVSVYFKCENFQWISGWGPSGSVEHIMPFVSWVPLKYLRGL
ncbi:MAG: hypothetical protein RBG13Loki_1649 [Promethearchaeota archaeon CR_4]|nr:MAG: hypothetical protein RBG13Loki_1649 [Candidatus Lokiarchaeota archaeon CR_4]